MCGIIGIISSDGLATATQVGAMAESVAHRGPDGCGIWVDEHAGVALGHRRLAILDLSPEGNQPKLSASGRYVTTYNGEIYNFTSLRSELLSKGHTFRGSSDTEVLLASIEEWGFEGALPRITGMFALAVWDTQERVLHLARDRIGEKPLYYGWSGGAFFFGSELAAFRAHPAFQPVINRDALIPLLRHGYIPAPLSIYTSIFKLPAGCWLSLSHAYALRRPVSFSAYAESAAQTRPRRYWSLNKIASAPGIHSFRGTADEAAERLEELLRDVISQQMIADVPVGAFLSGGIDSTTVVALMQQLSARAVRTFTIGFDEAQFNEAPYAKRISAHLGTEHTELYVGASDLLKVIPRLPQIYAEPFADSSQIPTTLVAMLARTGVTVSLSGDGGDELFCGYTRYQVTQRLWRTLSLCPRAAREGVSALLGCLPQGRLSLITGAIAPLLPRRGGRGTVLDKARRAFSLLPARSVAELYYLLFSVWPDAGCAVRRATEPPNFLSQPHLWPTGLSEAEQMMWLDTMHYLPDDIMVKIDRAAMASSLETRAPMLNHQLVEFAWSLPPQIRMPGKRPKELLRRVLHRHVPASLIDRPKMGFGAPIGQWLRGPLREWGEALLSEERLCDEEFFEPAPIRRMWREHQRAERNWQAQLWHVLMFQGWLEASKIRV